MNQMEEAARLRHIDKMKADFFLEQGRNEERERILGIIEELEAKHGRNTDFLCDKILETLIEKIKG